MTETESAGRVRSEARTRPLACVFDLDGTILDSEPLYFESDRAFLASRGMEYAAALNDAVKGRGAADFFAILASAFPGNPFHALPLTERMRLKDEAYLSHCVGRLRPFPAVVRLLDALGALGLPLAIASGSNSAVIEGTLGMVGLRDRFAVAVSAAEVPRGKPAPDVFLEAAHRLGVEPRSCLAFEDSPNGARAALDAGMTVVVLPDPGSGEGRDRFAGATLIVEGGPEALDPDKLLAELVS